MDNETRLKVINNILRKMEDVPDHMLMHLELIDFLTCATDEFIELNIHHFEDYLEKSK